MLSSGLFFLVSANNDLEFNKQIQLADSIRSSDPIKFDSIIKQLSAKKQQLSTNQLHYLNYLLSYQATYKGNYSTAISIAEQLTNSNADHLIKFRTKLMLVNVSASTQNWTDGLNYLSHVLAIKPTIQEKYLQQLSYIVTSIFYNRLGQHQLALTYAHKITPKDTDIRTQCIKSMQLLQAQFELEQLIIGAPLIASGINNCNKANEHVASAMINTYRAQLYLQNKNYSGTIKILEGNLESVKKTKFPRIEADYTSMLAKVYWLTHNVQVAKQYALETLKQDQALNSSPPFITAYKILYQIAEQEGDYQKALEYHVKYSDADKAYLDETKAKHLAFQLAKHHEFENKTQIRILDEQNRRLTLAKALSDKQQENNYLFIALLMTLMALLSGWAYKSWMNQNRLKELAEYDALTGIFNRGHFVQLSESTLKHHQKSQQEISCVIFDLDHFKDINDTFGHGVGDIVLKQIVDVCRSVGRHNDIFGRLGGEEFGFILPGCSIAIAEDIANKCRKLIQNIDYIALGLNSPITASFGVTDVKRSGFNLGDLLADADSAMYASKHHGRNTVTIFNSVTK